MVKTIVDIYDSFSTVSWKKVYLLDPTSYNESKVDGERDFLVNSLSISMCGNFQDKQSSSQRWKLFASYQRKNSMKL